jgi:uncharacterized protein YigE (DUF2233 family)
MNKSLSRNALGVTKDGKIVMVCSNVAVMMLELAVYMKRMGCVRAAYVHGSVSDYLKRGSKEENSFSSFGVMISGR